MKTQQTYLLEEPQFTEGDIVIADSWDNGYLATCDGRVIVEGINFEDIEMKVLLWMKSNQYFPNVFILSDHGNFHYTEVR